MDNVRPNVIILTESYRRHFDERIIKANSRASPQSNPRASPRASPQSNPRASPVCLTYQRRSIEDDKQTSIIPQLDYCRAFMEKNGFVYPENCDCGDFNDEDYSGFEFDRPGLEKLLETAIANKVDAVICYKLNRIARSESVYYRIEELLENHGIKIISCTEPFELNASSAFFKGITIAQNAYQSRELGQNVMRSQTKNAERGLSNGGKGPYGYLIVEKEYKKVPWEAKVVLEIFESTANGMSYQSLSDSLEARGIRTRNGNRWTKSTFNFILGNARKYSGTYTWNDSQKKRPPRKVVLGHYDEVAVEHAIPQIITPELAERTRQVMAARKGQNMKACELTLLKGIAKCSACGSMLQAASRKGGRKKTMQRTYKCKNHKSSKRPGYCPTKDIPREALETTMFRCLDTLFATPDFRAKLAEGLEPYKKKLREAIAEKERHKEKLERDKSNALRKSLDPEFGDDYAGIIREIKDGIEANCEMQAELNGKLAALESFTPDNLPHKSVAMFSNINKRLILEAAIAEIRATDNGDAVEITVK